MEKKDIIILVAVLAGLGFSLYKKYYGKDKNKITTGQPPKSGSLFSSHSKDDDYEPYSKK